MAIFVTVAVKEEFSFSYVIAGQAQLSLKDMDDVFGDKSYILTFIEKIKVRRDFGLITVLIYSTYD